MNGMLVIMGSGETAPTMVKPHRAIFERVGDRPALLLDTPYGFQENADDISTRAVGYFAASVGRTVEVLIDAASRRRPWEVSGRTTGNTVVNFPGPPGWVGEFVDVEIRRAGPNSLWGEPVGASRLAAGA